MTTCLYPSFWSIGRHKDSLKPCGPHTKITTSSAGAGLTSTQSTRSESFLGETFNNWIENVRDIREIRPISVLYSSTSPKKSVQVCLKADSQIRVASVVACGPFNVLLYQAPAGQDTEIAEPFRQSACQPRNSLFLEMVLQWCFKFNYGNSYGINYANFSWFL